jgi:hypothetical protein
MKIAIYLNKNHPVFLKVQEDLSKQLDALEAIKFRREIEPAQAGTLGIPGEVVAYVANHYKDIILIVNGIINVLSFIEKRRVAPSKKEKKPALPVFVLAIDGKLLKFPSSRQTQKKFLTKVKKLEDGGER